MQSLTCFEEIFRSHQVNGISLLAYKKLFSRHIYITVITLSFALLKEQVCQHYHFFFIISLVTFQELLAVGFYRCIRFILDESRCTLCRYSGERHAEVFPCRIFFHRLGQALEKASDWRQKILHFCVHKFQGALCCLVPAECPGRGR